MQFSNLHLKWLLLLTVLDQCSAKAPVQEMTFQIVGSKFSGMQISLRTPTPIACGGRCLLLPSCGAFAWNPVLEENCMVFLDVKDDAPDSQMENFYGGMILSNGKRLLKRPPGSPDRVKKAREICQAEDLLLVQNPATTRDRTMIASYRRIPLDITREDKALPYVNSKGNVVDTSMFREPLAENDVGNEDECVAGHFYGLWSLGCNTWDLSSDLTLCQEP